MVTILTILESIFPDKRNGWKVEFGTTIKDNPVMVISKATHVIVIPITMKFPGTTFVAEKMVDKLIKNKHKFCKCKSCIFKRNGGIENE